MNGKSEQAPNPEVILVLDRLHDRLYGLGGLSLDGSLELLEDVAGSLDRLLRFCPQDNPSEMFFRDFLLLSPEPLRYSFFKMATPSPLRFMEALESMLRDPVLYGGLIMEHMEPLERYLHLLPNEARQRLSCLEMDRVKVLPIDGGTGLGTMPPFPGSMDALSLKDLDVEAIKEAWGIDLQKLPDEILDRLLHRQATPLVWLYPKVQGVRFPLLASISLKRDARGGYTLLVSCIRSVDAMDKARGYLLTDSDHRQLRLKGHLDHPVPMRNPETGEVEPTLLGVDPLTSEPRILPRSSIRLPGTFMSHKLTPEEKQRLYEGERVTMRLLSSSGHAFEAAVSASAITGRLQVEFGSTSGSRRIPGSILGVALTKEQKSDLKAGAWIYLKGMTSAKGRLFNSYVRWKSPSGGLEFRLGTPENPISRTKASQGVSISTIDNQTSSPNRN